jgi:hypothetical protein
MELDRSKDFVRTEICRVFRNKERPGRLDRRQDSGLRSGTGTHLPDEPLHLERGTLAARAPLPVAAAASVEK